MAVELLDKTIENKNRRRVWLGLALTVIFNTVVQYLWKKAIPADASALGAVPATLISPWFHLAILLYFFQYFNWMSILARADLSFAQPITALSYVSISVMSVLALGESLPVSRMCGIGLILAGVWFISQTGHHSSSRPTQPQPQPQSQEVSV